MVQPNDANGPQRAYPRHRVGIRGLQNQVEMSAHQAIGTGLQSALRQAAAGVLRESCRSASLRKRSSRCDCSDGWPASVPQPRLSKGHTNEPRPVPRSQHVEMIAAAEHPQSSARLGLCDRGLGARGATRSRCAGYWQTSTLSKVRRERSLPGYTRGLSRGRGPPGYSMLILLGATLFQSSGRANASQNVPSDDLIPAHVAADVRVRAPQRGRHGGRRTHRGLADGLAQIRSPKSEIRKKSEVRRNARAGRGCLELLERPFVGRL